LYKSKSESLQSEGESIKQLKQNLAVLREEFNAHHEKFEECKQKLSNEMITTDLQKEVQFNDFELLPEIFN
jgi:kinesin family protein 20